MAKKKADDRETDALIERMLFVLRSRRLDDGGVDPPTLRQLAERAEIPPSDDRLAIAVRRKPFTDRAIVARLENGTPDRDAPVLLKDDLETEAILPPLLAFALSRAATASTQAFTPAQLKTKLVADLRGAFLSALDRALERQSLPPEFGWVLIANRPHLFAWKDLKPTARAAGRTTADRGPDPPPVEGPMTLPFPSPDLVPRRGGPSAALAASPPTLDFAAAFDEVFGQIDRRNGSTNLVKLSDLRRALADFDRQRFDAGLRQLRLTGGYELGRHDGLSGPLTIEDCEAGILEADAFLIYVSRR